MNAFVEYYRCSGLDDMLTTTGPLSAFDGYFQFGDVVAYGRVAGSAPAPVDRKSLRDLHASASTAGGRVRLPFDLSAVVENMRRERYRQNGETWLRRSTTSDAVRRVYYAIRPFMRVGVRRHLQKAHFKGWKKIAFPRWPVDLSVDKLMEASMVLALEASGRDRIPFVWFWPEGASACAMMTHDVEGKAGLDFCDELMDIDEAHGVPSAFQLIPEVHGRVWPETARRLRARGFEVNLHDLNHDGRLFANRTTFLERAQRINHYARQFGCKGFRSGAMYREQDWFDAFDFAYDMSVPNAAHLEPQRGGCCTVMPYFVGGVLELPLTTTQDYTLFHILGDYSTTLWEEQIRLIVGRHGLVSVIAHPDYLTGARARDVYVQLLRHLVDLRDRQGVWMALPGEIDRWWRNRQQMTLVPDGDGWRIGGPDHERARVAYASLSSGRLVYSVQPGVLGHAGARPVPRVTVDPDSRARHRQRLMTPIVIDDPIHDPRWADLLGRHPSASVFHTPAWLQALRRTYGYEPVAVTTSRGAQIENGLVACRVRAWGASRLVSVPFSDHCEPLASGPDLQALVDGLIALAHERRWGPVELRPRSAGHVLDAAAAGRLRPVRSYSLHDLDLGPELPQIFARFQHSSMQRAVRRAEREGVTYEAGTSDEQLHAFFGLLRMARRRHGLPPQPMAWFRNLRDAAGNRLTVHLARHDGRPIASLLTLSFRETIVYKYGGSDAARHAVGAMPFLLWRAIQGAKAIGATSFDLGRSDLDQRGLIAFKNHLGARQTILTYYGSSSRFPSFPGQAWMSRTAGRVVSGLPDMALDLAGRLLYRHLG